jgi:hypothetical protein
MSRHGSCPKAGQGALSSPRGRRPRPDPGDLVGDINFATDTIDFSSPARDLVTGPAAPPLPAQLDDLIYRM